MSKVLVVDDDKDIRDSLAKLIERDGHTVVACINGEKALVEIIENGLPDIIISDINMPDMDGYTLIKHVRKIEGAEFLPTVFLSARTSLKDQEKGFMAGVDNYICKPITRAYRPILLSMITALINKAASQKKKVAELGKCSLTELPRRENYLQTLNRQIGVSQREGKNTSIAIIDIDFFKKVNDTYGHAIGDEVLRLFAKSVLSSLRQTDCFFRYGGEEFTLIAPKSNASETKVLLERVQFRLSEVKWPKAIQVSFSAGICELPSYPEISEAAEYMATADDALYVAKKTRKTIAIGLIRHKGVG